MRCLYGHLKCQIVSCGKIASFQSPNRGTWHSEDFINHVDQARESSLFHERNILHHINLCLNSDELSTYCSGDGRISMDTRSKYRRICIQELHTLAARNIGI